MSIMLDEANAYENSRDYDCCQIIDGAFTVGCAVNEAYCDGRSARPTNMEIEAVAKRLLWRSRKWDGIDSDYAVKDEEDAWNHAGELLWDYAGEILGWQEHYRRLAEDLLNTARKAVTE